MDTYTKPPAGGSLLADLSTAEQCTAAGITGHGHTPILALCRKLLAAGHDPDTPLIVYRNGTLALRVRSTAEGAALAVKEPDRGRPHFAPWRPFDAACVASPASPVASPVRRNGAAYGEAAE